MTTFLLDFFSGTTTWDKDTKRKNGSVNRKNGSPPNWKRTKYFGVVPLYSSTLQWVQCSPATSLMAATVPCTINLTSMVGYGSCYSSPLCSCIRYFHIILTERIKLKGVKLQDYMTYWLHRIYHMPFLYKRFHKLHHRYKQPTAFSVTAIHPVESIHIQLFLATPLILVPVHWCKCDWSQFLALFYWINIVMAVPFYTSAFYAYYHGILDHSGVNFKSYWWQPWQPDAIFHDNHHQYFHVNFAFNISYWDKVGWFLTQDRIYIIFFSYTELIEEKTEFTTKISITVLVKL